MLLAGLVIGAVALVMDWYEFAIVGGVCLALFVGAMIFTIGAVSLSVRIDTGASRAVVGDRLMGVVEVTNRRRRPAYGLRIEVPVGDSVASFAVRRLRGGETIEEMFVIPTNERGVLDIGPVMSVKGDPIGLVRRPRKWTGVERTYIHPRTARLQPLRQGRVSDLDGQPTSSRAASDLAFHSLRDYVAGDDLRHVHWRVSARHGNLMVRQYNETRRSQVLVIISANIDDYMNADEFELAISIAATIGRRVQLDQQTLTVVVGERELPTHSPMSLLDRWSEVNLDERFQSDGIVLSRRLTPGATTVVHVTGSGADQRERLAKLRRAQWSAELYLMAAAPGLSGSYRDTETGVIASVPDLRSAANTLGRVLS